MQFDRSKRPESSGIVNFNLPVIKKFKLSNGLETYFCEKNELPIIRLNLLVNSGSRFDPVKSKGLSNMLSMCIDEGAGNYNALEVADEFEMLGAQFSSSSDSDISRVSIQVMTENFTPALKLFSSITTEPHLAEEDFSREKRKLLVRLNQAKMEPDYVADISFEHFLFGNYNIYSYPVLGVEQDIQNIKIQTVREFYKNKFSPLNSTLIVVGNVNSELLNTSLEEYLGAWSNSSTNEQQEISNNNFPGKIFIVNKPDSVQTEIRTGHLTTKRNEKDFFQKHILNLVLGGQFSSRLNLNLREKHGYTYGIHSSFSYFIDAGYFAVSTSVDTVNTGNALKEIISEIKSIKDGITNEELDFAKSSLTKRFPSNFETYRQIASNIGSKLIHNLPEDYFETYIQKLNSVKIDDVNSVAMSAIHSDELITVLVGDSVKLLNQLSKDEFGEIEVVEFDDVFNR